MKSFNFPTHRSLSSIATVLTLILFNPQTALAQATGNTAFGSNALVSNTSGSNNTAFGDSALKSNTVGTDNTAFGVLALLSNISGTGNTAIGELSLVTNTTGFDNTAVGEGALFSNNDGAYNAACGKHALYANTNGAENTASGYEALRLNTSGYGNTASGTYSIFNNAGGWGNTASGYQSLFNNVSGHNNVAIGFKAGYEIKGSNNIVIGGTGDAGDNNTMRLGNGSTNRVFVVGVSGKTTSGGVQVYINSSGQLGTLTSSQRFKKEIKSIETVGDKLQQLRPVSFVYKDDETNQTQFGLIAEEVAKVYPELVQYDQEGKPYTVYYQFLTPLLLSELQKEHAASKAQEEKIDAQQTTLAAQQSELVSLTQQLMAQRSEMSAVLQQQKQQLADMSMLQEKLNQLGNLVQANNATHLSSEQVALATSH